MLTDSAQDTSPNQAVIIDGVDTTGWSSEWRARVRRATRGLSVPQDTPRGRSERRFLTLLRERDGLTFRELCDLVVEPPSAAWGPGPDRWVRDLLTDLRRVGSVTYDKQTRRWSITDRGAAAADAPVCA